MAVFQLSEKSGYFRGIEELKTKAETAYVEHGMSSVPPGQRLKIANDRRDEFFEKFMALMVDVKDHVRAGKVADPDAYLSKFEAWHAVNSSGIGNKSQVPYRDFNDLKAANDGPAQKLTPITEILNTIIRQGNFDGLSLARQNPKQPPKPQGSALG